MRGTAERVIWLLSASVALAACGGGDNGTNGTTTGSGGSGSTTSTSGAGTGATTTSSSGTSGSSSGSSTGSNTSSGGSTGGTSGQPDPACIDLPAGIPDALDAGPGVVPAIQVFGMGTQNYSCVFVDAGTLAAAWSSAVPEANLYQCGPDGGQVGTHFSGPTWEWAADSSTFVGNKTTGVTVASPDDAGYDIPWLLLPKKTGTDAGVMGPVLFAQRLSTVGGTLAWQDAGCDLAAADAGRVVKVPYTATYVFYEAP